MNIKNVIPIKINVDFKGDELSSAPYYCYSREYANTMYFGQLYNKMIPIECYEETLDLIENCGPVEQEELIAESIDLVAGDNEKYRIANAILKPNESTTMIDKITNRFKEMCVPQFVGTYDESHLINGYISNFGTVLIITGPEINHDFIKFTEQSIHMKKPFTTISIFTVLAKEENLI